MANRRDQIEELFKASLSFGFEPEKNAGDFYEESSMIKLASGAGVMIPNPTYDKIISFVSELVSRDISDIAPEGASVSVEFVPSEQEGIGSTLIRQGSGEVKISPTEGADEFALEIPFLVINGSLAPFDVIQLNGERAPYTRENLAKALNALAAQGNNQTLNSEGYVRLEKMHNPSTSQGFLDDTLNVRHRGNVIPDIGGMFVTASEKVVDGILKEAATLSPVDWSKVEAAAEALAAKNYRDFIKAASDEGEEISAMVKTASRNSDLSRTLPWKNVKNVKNKTFIKFPELYDGGITMTPGLVLKDLKNVFELDNHPGDVDFFVVITADGRIKEIKREDEGFICYEISGKPFKLLGCYIDGLRKHDTFIARMDDGSFTAPITISRDDVRRLNTKQPLSHDNDYPRTADKRADVHSVISLRVIECKITSNRSMTTCVLPTEKSFFGRVNGDDVAKDICRRNEAAIYDAKMIVPIDSRIFGLSKGKRLISVTGTIGKTFLSLDAVEAVLYGDRVKVAGEDFDEMMKLASLADTITVTKLRNDKYNIKVKYQDKTEKMFEACEETLEGLSESAAIGALIALNFSRSSATDLMVKVNHGTQVSCSLPANANPAKIFSSKKHKIKKAVAAFKRSGADEIIGNAVGDILMDKAKENVGNKIVGPFVKKALMGTPLAKNQFFVNTVLDKSASLRDEAKTVSAVFEKRAVAEENATMRKCAKIMAMCSYFNDDCIKVMADPDNYPHFDKIAKEIVDARPILEEAIDDLLTEKIAYYKSGENHPMSVSFYGAAIGNMDNTFKIASGIVRGMEKKAFLIDDKEKKIYVKKDCGSITSDTAKLLSYSNKNPDKKVGGKDYELTPVDESEYIKAKNRIKRGE